MGFRNAFGGALQAMHSPAAFGEPVTIRRADGSMEYETHGIIETDDLQADVDGRLVSTHIHTVGLRRSGLPWEPGQQDLVLVEGRTYVVADTFDEGQDILTLQVHEGS